MLDNTTERVTVRIDVESLVVWAVVIKEFSRLAVVYFLTFVQYPCEV